MADNPMKQTLHHRYERQIEYALTETGRRGAA